MTPKYRARPRRRPTHLPDKSGHTHLPPPGGPPTLCHRAPPLHPIMLAQGLHHHLWAVALHLDLVGLGRPALPKRDGCTGVGETSGRGGGEGEWLVLVRPWAAGCGGEGGWPRSTWFRRAWGAAFPKEGCIANDGWIRTQGQKGNGWGQTWGRHRMAPAAHLPHHIALLPAVPHRTLAPPPSPRPARRRSPPGAGPAASVWGSSQHEGLHPDNPHRALPPGRSAAPLT